MCGIDFDKKRAQLITYNQFKKILDEISENVDSLNNFEKSIAVIGTRNPTDFSKKIAFVVQIFKRLSNRHLQFKWIIGKKLQVILNKDGRFNI